MLLPDPQASPEHQKAISFVEYVLDLPWGRFTQSARLPDVALARKMLDDDHFGLDAVKKRIIEFIAVRWHNPGARGSILCLVGPPGVGKTSLGKSIAGVLGRDFHRVSLGGVRDEADIRGFHRTYVGSQPGRIVQGLRRVSTADPVMLLDEIDKVGAVCWCRVLAGWFGPALVPWGTGNLFECHLCVYASF